jgi:AraC-like DNA-binding protein
MGRSGGIQAALKNRDIAWIEPRMLRVRQRVEVRGREPGADATGPYWVFAVVHVHRGALRYVHGREERAPPGRRFAVFMPPWSVVRAAPATCVVSTEAIASDAPFPDGAPTRAVAWPWPAGAPPRGIEEIARAVRGGGPFVEVSREVDPPESARRVKALLDEAYCRPVTIARLAARMGRSPSAMSRDFKRAYGMPPVEYRHRLRVMDAIFRLAAGGEILSVLHDVGFGDTSRMYTHFRTLLCAPPGTYSARRSRNAKT